MQATRIDVGPTSWRSLAEIALEGLSRTYGDEVCLLPYTRRWDGRRAVCSGRSVRHALISLLGLARASHVVGEQHALGDSIWKRVVDVGRRNGLSPGDLGLALWTQAVYDGSFGEFTAERALRAFEARPESCDSVDLAWLLTGAEHVLMRRPDDAAARKLADTTKRDLLTLYNPTTSLFYRHARTGLMRSVSRRIACFANQIYPVLGLAVHARRTGCSQALDAAMSVADNVCRLQGARGQWWWLYDAGQGGVVDGYPVFSVHQHGMAPMALLEAGAVAGRSYAASIARGLAWISGDNEVGADLVLREQGMILREIHRRGFGRWRRMIRGVLWCCGRHRQPSNGNPGARFEINAECRPYELGWLLYAAGLAVQGRSAPLSAEAG